MRDHVPPLGTLRVVSGEDPAIDVVATGGTNLRLYMTTRDERALVFKPGATPTWYTLRDMPELAYVWCEEAPTPAQKLIRALEACLVAIENPVKADGSQSMGVHTLQSIERPDLGCSLVSRGDFLPMIRPRGAWWEMGHLAFWRSELSPKARFACEMLPGSLRRICARFSDAETIRAFQALALQQQKSDAPSAETGDATATESGGASPATP